MNLWTALAVCACFETQDLVCRPPGFGDCEAFFGLVSDETNRQFSLPFQTERARSDDFFVDQFLREPLGKWAICLAGSDRLIGLIWLEKLVVGPRTAEVAYLLHKDYWNRGYMTQCLRELTDQLNQVSALKQLDLLCHLPNKASQRVAEKAGFEPVGQFRGRDRYGRQIESYCRYRWQGGGRCE